MAAAVACASLTYLIGCGEGPEEAAYQATEGMKRPATTQLFPVSHDPERMRRFGPEACVECHAESVAEWRRSHHAKANRPVSVTLDRAAFHPTRRIRESGVTYELSENGGDFRLRVIEADGSKADYDLVGVIGETPLRQYLAVFPGNRFQTISATYSVLDDRWVDVFAEENREPGEWGHWTGQGMNWNANCAYCHTTEYSKGFDLDENLYHSTWTQQGLACAECHGGLEAHLEAARAGDFESGLVELTTEQTIQNCATCHSRRDQLTADAFEPGDAFHDHFALSLPDQPGLYFADGQIRDEVFVYASFKMSTMAHAGVRCLDCHNPHSLEPILPVDNNMLCMRCHESGVMEAPVIEPTQHSFHPAGSTGNRCVECHMPKRTYMQVDPRADHGFHSPDPLMTREFGIPNACSNCHQEEGLDWAVKWSEQWYGDALESSRQRRRARTLSAAYDFDPAAVEQLLALLEGEAIPAWRATYAGLLSNSMPRAEVESRLKTLLDDPEPMVRSRAVSGLAAGTADREAALDALADDAREVRISAARSLSQSDTPVSGMPAEADWEAYLNFNADRPQTLFILAHRANREGDTAAAERYVTRAVGLDSKNPEMYHQAAILLSGAGANTAAERYLYQGWDLAPDNPVFPYSLGLLAAETGELAQAIAFLEETVAMEPAFSRAWYNLSLAYRQAEQPEKARQAMQRARAE